MASSRVRRAEPCTFENCGSRRFHLGDDGFTYCDQGHQQSERGTIVTEDPGELLNRGRRSRKKDSDAESNASKASTFGGSRAFEHYLLCIQLILRKQLRWLIDMQKLPEELDALVRDLWALRLQRLQGKASYESDAETEALSSSQVFSSQSESETATGSQSSRKRRQPESKPREDSPKLTETLSLCYVGILLLRIPVTVADVHRWANNGELLFYKAAREVPLGMRERLPSVYQDLLQRQNLLQPQALHQSVVQVITMFHEDFGMATPPINIPLVLYRWIKDLALPLEVFVASQRLARVLQIDFSYGGGETNVILRYPEARLMAAVVVSTKMLFPFDGIKRHPEAIKDLSSFSLDWNVWVKSHNDDDEDTAGKSALTFERAFNFTETDCIDAAEGKLDAYLDWYSENVATEDIREHGRAGRDADFRRSLFKMFPADHARSENGQKLSSGPDDRVNKRVRRVQSTLQTTDVVDRKHSRSDTLRPGSLYRRYRHVEDLSGPAKGFFEETSRLAGLPLDDMVQAVFLTERKVQKHEEALLKGGRTR